MQTIIRKKGAFDPLKFELDLSTYGKTIDDITDVFFSIKTNEKNADDTIFLKTLVDGDITITQNKDKIDVIITWEHDEYDDLIITTIYTAGLFAKFDGDPVADEHVNQLFKLQIVQDFLRS